MAVNFDEATQIYLFACPHCNDLIQVARADINCQIFRHAVYKNNHMQIPPHSSKEVCDALIASGEVYGCARPFIFNGNAVFGTDQYN